jgi:hypothetical protein
MVRCKHQASDIRYAPSKQNLTYPTWGQKGKLAWVH